MCNELMAENWKGILGNTLRLWGYKASISESAIDKSLFFSELYKIHINTTNMYLVG